MCLCAHTMDVEDIVSSPRVNTEWVTAGLRWISLTGEQRLSLSQQSESEMRRRGTRGMSGRGLNDDVEYGDLATGSRADSVMKILENRVKEGEMGWWRWEDGKASAAFSLQNSRPSLHLPSPWWSVCVCEGGGGRHRGERKENRGKI